jgi:hypothetical protein
MSVLSLCFDVKNPFARIFPAASAVNFLALNVGAGPKQFVAHLVIFVIDGGCLPVEVAVVAYICLIRHLKCRVTEIYRLCHFVAIKSSTEKHCFFPSAILQFCHADALSHLNRCVLELKTSDVHGEACACGAWVLYCLLEIVCAKWFCSSDSLTKQKSLSFAVRISTHPACSPQSF